MQFTDLMLVVLAQFPESPDGCHSDRLRGEERSTTADYETHHGATDRAMPVKKRRGREPRRL